MSDIEVDLEIGEKEAQSERAQKRPYNSSFKKKVVDLYLLGHTKEQIADELKVPFYKVAKVCFDTRIKYFTKLAAEKVEDRIQCLLVKDKIPTIREIIDMSLEQVKIFLLRLKDPVARAWIIKDVKDVKVLSDIATNLNTLLRLEEGKSTENIEVHKMSIDETRVILEEIAKKDPVFEYPQLGNGQTSDINGEAEPSVITPQKCND